jgi:hypothetical protein
MILITDSPKAHRFIGDNEKDYLIQETKKAVAAKEKGLVKNFKRVLLEKLKKKHLSLNLSSRKHHGKKYSNQKFVGLQ